MADPTHLSDSAGPRDYPVCNRAFLAALRALQGVGGKAELQHAVDCDPRTTEQALDTLVDDGAVNTRKIGQHHVYWRTGHAETITNLSFDADDTGTYPDTAFLEALQTHGGLAGTGEVAETVGCTRRTAHGRLDDLKADGQILGRTLQPINVYWVTELAPGTRDD
jgi:hypothetical protein